MANTLITKNSSTAAAIPTAGQLVQGELAVNVTDKRVFTENSGGTVVELGTNPSSLTLTSGTANGVPYLNASKVLTSGSALTFDGSTRLLANGVRLDIDGGTSADQLRLGTDPNYYKIGRNSSSGPLEFYGTQSGVVSYVFGGVNGEYMRLTSTGLGIGVSSPTGKLDVGSVTGSVTSGDFIVTTASTTASVTVGRLSGTGSDNTTFNVRNRVGASVLYVDTGAGSVGIGTSSPTKNLVVYNGTTDPAIAIQTDTSGATSTDGFQIALQRTTNNAYLNLRESGDMIFQTSNTERLRLTSAGNVLINDTVDRSNSLVVNAPATVNTLYLNVQTGYNSGIQFAENNSVKWQLQSLSSGAGFRFYDNVAGQERVRIDSSGNLLVGTTSSIDGSRITSVAAGSVSLGLNGSGGAGMIVRHPATNQIDFTTVATSSFFTFSSNTVERVRIDSSGNLLVGSTSTGGTVAGVNLYANGEGSFVRSAGSCIFVNRLTDDGILVNFYQNSTQEGSISVSGTTVSYNGGHLSRWAQTTTTKDETLVKGTVLSNLDAMNVYIDADGNIVDNEQLNKVKVSDLDGDTNVAGVFVNWGHDEAHDVDEINMAMTGDMIIRIAQGVTVVRGDLLMSAGNGTAKPQGDDIVRSKTIAKVTSTHVTCTYEDGSFCVPCVLMAC
jgi:hypothetical protein